MKIYGSTFLSLFFLLALAGCGAEQFGVTPQNEKSTTNAIKVYDNSSCAGMTLIKPEVDILYVVDNSSSNGYISSSIKTVIQNTIGSISDKFDYRIIGTPLISSDNNDYQVLAKDPGTLPSYVTGTQKVSSVSGFTFFSSGTPGNTPEKGLERIQSFISQHASNSPTAGKLLRNKAYLFVIIVSNGNDESIERGGINNTATTYAPADDTNSYIGGLNRLNNLKSSYVNSLKATLQSQQFRLFSIVAQPGCVTQGYKIAPKSYMEMSKYLYGLTPFPSDQSGKQYPDTYNLCDSSGIQSVFSSVNSAIQQIILPHTYQYWVATETSSDIDTNPGQIRVFKNTSSSAPVEMIRPTQWDYFENTGSVNTRILPSVGEPTTKRHLVKFTSGNYITYPDCVSVRAASNKEFFGYVVLPKKPRLDTVVLKIDGRTIPQSNTNGWSYVTASPLTNFNIKVNYTDNSGNSYLDTPAVLRTGYMLKLNGGNNYYMSGENIEIYYVPETL